MRVSVEEQPVEILAPEERVFNWPNKITPKDFDGWVQERGLYFMSQWDAQFKPLLACNDPGEPPQKGGLLLAHYGKGIYIFSAYGFSRQLPAGVPGAITLVCEPGKRGTSMTEIPQPPVPGLAREVNLREATALNIIDMIGVGPFVTIPLIIHAMHGPQAMLGWVLGALLAMCDGLVWAELGASMPQAGGSYQYLKESYGAKRLGRLMSFLFVWQLIFSAPLSIASGCLGIARYAEYVWPSLSHVLVADRTVSLGLGPLGALEFRLFITHGTFVAMASCLLALWLLYRRVSVIGQLARYLSVGVLGAILLVIVAGLSHFNAARAFTFAPGAFQLLFRIHHRTGRGHAGGHLRLLGLLQRLLSGRGDQAAGAQHSARHPDFHRDCGRAVSGDEHQHPGRAALAGAGPGWRERVALLRCFHAAATHLRDVVGNVWRLPDHVDGIRFRIFAHAGLFARAVCGGAGRKLLSRLRQAASQTSVSSPFFAHAGHW